MDVMDDHLSGDIMHRRRKHTIALLTSDWSCSRRRTTDLRPDHCLAYRVYLTD